MGFGVSELLILLIIVALLFGTKKLRNMGGDLGSAVKSFKSAMKEPESEEKLAEGSANEGNVIEGELESSNDQPPKT